MADALTLDIEKRHASGVVVSARLEVAIGAGDILVLFGPSGSGKTTVLRSVAGLERPERGVVRFAGETWFDSASNRFLEPQDRRTGYVFQEGALFPHLTVRQNVEFGVRGRPTDGRAERFPALLDRVGVAEIADRPARQLSGGQVQRVALARALAPGPRLLLLDEPFASLDTPARTALRRLLRASIEELRIPAVLVTHDRGEAMALGDHMAVLAGGRVRQVGPVLSVFRRPADLVVAQSVGVDSVLPARLERLEDGLADLRVGPVVLRAVASEEEAAGGRDVFACIRAEDVTLERGAPAHASARNHLPGRIVSIESDGPLDRVVVDCGFPLAALITRNAREELVLAVGTPVTAAVKATAIHLVPRL